jgi:MFS family permease
MSAPAGDRVEPRHFAFLGLLTLLNVLNFVDRQLLASFANFVIPDLGLTNTQFGLLTGFNFLIFYAVMGLFAGTLADRVHRPRLIAAGIALWSALTAVSGAARGFASLALPRMFIGVGESVLTPSSMSLLSDRFPPRLLGFAAGAYYMGVPIGVAVSLLITGYLGPVLGWRKCFALLGVIGIGLAALMAFIPETPRRHVAAAGSPKPSFGNAIGTLLTALRASPALVFTMAGGIALHFILGAATFDQLWYVQERGFERAEVARWTGWIGLVGGVLGNLLGGLGSDWWLRRTGTGRPMFLFWVSLVLSPLGFVYRLVPGDSPWFWIGLFSGYVQLGAIYGPTFSTVQELVPPQIRATVVAFFILVLNLVGLGIGITAGGVVLDGMIARGVHEPYTKTLLAFTALSATALPLFWLAGKRFVSDRDRLYGALATSTA